MRPYSPPLLPKLHQACYFTQTHTYTRSHKSTHLRPHTGFHNASLYEALRPSISPLVALLRGEEEDKTRANAAGALGNLVRNSSQLCGELIKVGNIVCVCVGGGGVGGYMCI